MIPKLWDSSELRLPFLYWSEGEISDALALSFYEHRDQSGGVSIFLHALHGFSATLSLALASVSLTFYF